MELLFAVAIAVLVACGVYLALRERTFDLVLGITLLSYAVNLFLFASGRLVLGSVPLTDRALASAPDPLPQALVLTAIVIGFGMTALLVALAIRTRSDSDHERVDGDQS